MSRIDTRISHMFQVCIDVYWLSINSEELSLGISDVGDARMIVLGPTQCHTGSAQLSLAH
jgi:hypothetical protein